MSDPRSRPTIDHGLLSPSGRVSARARRAALRREHARLFPPGYWALREVSAPDQLRRLADAADRTAAQLRDLAARGQKPRAYPKKAAELEAQAAKLRARARELEGTHGTE